MKNIVIINIYDSGYGFSVLVDNTIYYKMHDDLADEILSIYYDSHINFHDWLKEKFKDKTIIICEDGGIEVL